MSLALLVVFGAFGWSALPGDLTRSAAALSFRDAAANGTGIAAPVFLLRDNGSAVRFGNAALASDGVIRVGFYDPLDPLLAGASEAVSLPADVRLLWLLASPDERRTLRDGTGNLALALSRAMMDIMRSPEFVADYRDRFLQVFRSDLQKAWEVTRASGAWQDLLRGYEPVLRETSSRELRPIIEAHFRSVPMRMLRANALGMIDPFHDREWNTQPVEEALQTAIQEIRDRDIPERTVARLLATQPTATFLRVFADAVAGELAHDPALKDLIGDMLFDGRFRPYFDETIAQVAELGRIAPRLLISLHGSTDLNPVASVVIRTMVANRADRVVVFMNPQQRDELTALDAASVHPLRRAASS